jgi:hypothetical protein
MWLVGLEHISIDHYGNISHLGRYPSQMHTWGTFIDLTKSISAPENDAACAAVLKLLTV